MFAGGVLRHRGENLLEVINREKHAAQLLEEVAKDSSGGGPKPPLYSVSA